MIGLLDFAGIARSGERLPFADVVSGTRAGILEGDRRPEVAAEWLCEVGA